MASAERNEKYEANDNLDTYPRKSNRIHNDCLQQNWFIMYIIIRQHNNNKRIQIDCHIQKGE